MLGRWSQRVRRTSAPRADRSDHRAAPGAVRALVGAHRVLDQHRGRRRVLHLHLRAAAAPAAVPRHDHRGRRHRCPRLVPRVSARPSPAALPARGLVTRLLRGVSGRAVLLPAPGAPDRHPRRLPPVQRRVQARHRARADPLADRRVRVRPRHPRAAARARALRRRRHVLPVLQGRRRSDHEVRPPHHGRDAHEHARGRVLVHDRGSRARCSSSARSRARSTSAGRCGCPRCSSRRR